MDKLKAAGMIASGRVDITDNNSSEEKVAWSDLVEEYPDKWIIYKDMEIVDDDRLFLCKVVEICDDSVQGDRRLYYLNNGIKVNAMRTTTCFNGCMGRC